MIEKSAGNDGGKSGEFFFFSYDNQLVIKTITRSELNVLKKINANYFKHIQTYPETMIS